MLYELSLLFITNAIAVTLVIIVMLSRTVPKSVRLTLIATILSLLLWQDSIFIADNVSDNLVLWNTVIFVWPTLAVASCFLFIQMLHRSRRRSREPHSLLTYPFAGAIIAQLIPVVSLTIFSAVYMTDAGLEFDRQLGYYIYLAGLIASILILIADIVIRRKRSAKNSLERYAINTVLVTVVVASFYGILMNAIVPVLTGDQAYIALGILVIDIFAIGLSLSIAKGHLLDIRFYAVRTTVYILSLATLALAYAFLAYIISEWILGYGLSSAQSTINIALALVLAFIFQPIRRFFDKITSKIFYRDAYDSDEFFARLNKELAVTSDIRGLMERVASYVTDTLKAEHTFFYVHHRRGGAIQVGSGHFQKISAQDARELEEHSQGGALISLEAIGERSTRLRRLLISNKIDVALPLRRDDEILGFFILGSHRQGSYTSRDLRLLSAVADELSIAIQNALSIQEVKDINATLQQRIDAATKELRASNAQLQKLDEAKDEFISMASHQLRTPLTSIKGYISMLVEGDVGAVTKEQKHLLEEAFVSSERMVRLIGDFLNVSRLQTGKFVIEKKPVNLAALVASEIEALESNAATRNLKFVYKRPAHFPELMIDENKFQQVIMNFADNAIYYSKEASKITVSLREVDGMVEFTVKDTGIGVPADQQEQLFSKFFRASNARQQRPDGTGVGLFLAKKVIDAHGGTVVFESKEGKGSTFGFRLPIKKLSK